MVGVVATLGRSWSFTWCQHFKITSRAIANYLCSLGVLTAASYVSGCFSGDTMACVRSAIPKLRTGALDNKQ